MLNTSNSNNYEYKTKELELHILGGLELKKLESLRVTLSIEKSPLPSASPQRGESKTVLNILRDTVNLYNDSQVEKLTRKAAERLEIGTSVVRATLQELTRSLESYRFLLSEQNQIQDTPYIKTLSRSEEKEAIAFLGNKELLARTNEVIGASGVLGESVNRLLMYLIFTSRKTTNPLHCISLGSSGSGKTHLQSKVADLIPEEDKVEITVLSANAFYYFNRTELQHKLILIEDLDGAESVLYPLRELQSKKRITKTVVHKDRKGNTKTIHLTVEGPVSVSGCTTQESIYEDNSNRSFLLHIDESAAQDKRIMDYQRLISAGKIDEEKMLASSELLQNVQRVLRPIKVINPYAMYLSLPSAVFKPRRTNAHYLQLIEVITFYHQYQRQKQYDEVTGEEYIETAIEDIQEANDLIIEVLLRKSDSLTGACRNHLENLKKYLKENKQTTFTNAEIRRNLRIKQTTLLRYNQQLIGECYIKKLKGKKGQAYYYEIVDIAEYKQLKDHINKALEDCLTQINLTT